nr:hypothetical protein [Tanacetum cinerariifolium]
MSILPAGIWEREHVGCVIETGKGCVRMRCRRDGLGKMYSKMGYDNGTVFKNSVMNQFFEDKGIKRELSVARTPHQNKAEAVNTACYVLNRALVTKPHNKTPYELIHGRPLLIDFMKPFGCPVTILNTRDNLGKFEGKANEGYFVRYSVDQKNLVAGQDDTKKALEQEYILIPICTTDPLLYQGSKDSTVDVGKKAPEVDENDTAIFGNAYDDEVLEEDVDMNNVDSSYTIPESTKFFKDHPKNKNKKDKRRIVIKNKARLVAQGHTQEEGIDYDEAVKRIFGYLKGQPKLSLWYPRGSPFDLEAYSNSDYARASLDRKSIIGGCQFLSKRLMIAKDGGCFVDTSEVTTDETVYKERGDRMERAAATTSSLEADIRSDLQFDDAEGTVCLLNEAIFEGLACMGAKTTAWNEFSSTMASAIICLADNQKFNFSKYIFDNMVKSLEGGVKFYLFLRFFDPLPSGEDNSILNELMVFCTSLQEQRKSRSGGLQRLKKIGSGRRVKSPMEKDGLGAQEDASKQGRMIREIDQNTEIALDDETQGRTNDDEMFGVDDLAGEEVVIETTTGVKDSAPLTADLTEDEVIMAQALDALKSTKPRVVVHEKEMSTTIPGVATIVTNVVLTLRAKGIVFHKQKQSQIPTVSSLKDKGQAKMIEPEVPIKKKDQMRIDEEYARKLEAEEQEAERSFDEIKELFDKEMTKVNDFIAMNSEAQESSTKRTAEHFESDISKKQKVDENFEPVIDDSEELKKCIEIVPDDRDEEVLWAIVKDRFKKEKLVDDMDNILFRTLKTMFEHHVEDTIWKYQQGLAKVKNWKLFESCGVYCITMHSTIYYLLVEKVYPLTRNTLHQLWSDVRLQVDYDVEMAYDLLRFIKKQLMEDYTPQCSVWIHPFDEDKDFEQET